MHIQYPLPFTPPWAWWIAREAERERDRLIDAALWAASLETWWPWRAPTISNDSTSSEVEQLEFAFGVFVPYRISPAAVATVVERLSHDDDDDDEGDDRQSDAERRPTEDSALHPLRDGVLPDSPTTAWAQIDDIVQGLRERGVHGHDELLRTLALLVSPSYRAQGFGPRFLLTAPPAAGKTFLLGALAETLGIPSLHIDASILTPEGWSGTNVSDLIGPQLGRGPERFTLEQWRNGAVLVLDEIDKACRADDNDRYGTQVRLERQHTMLGLIWGGTPIRLKDGDTIKTDRWIIAACGAFASTRFVAEHRAPTDAELIAWGMSPELASRLPIRLTIAPQPIPALIERLRHDPRGLPHATQLAATLGYTLEVPTPTLARLAVLMHESPNTFSMRTASAAIVQAVIQQLSQAGSARVGERVVVTPDDLPLVHARRGPVAPPNDDPGALKAP